MRKDEEKRLLSYSLLKHNVLYDENGKEIDLIVVTEEKLPELSEAVEAVYELVMNKDEITQNDIENCISNLYSQLVMAGIWPEEELSRDKYGIKYIPEEHINYLRPMILIAIQQVDRLKNGKITIDTLRKEYEEMMSEKSKENQINDN